MMIARLVTFILIWFLLWLQIMLFLHEIGHAITAKLLSVRITFLDLYPLRIGSTLFDAGSAGWLKSNLIIWGGFVLGSLIPLATYSFWRTKTFGLGIFLQGLTLFCWLANSLYLALGTISSFGNSISFSDSGLLIAEGWPNWLLIIVGGGLGAVSYVQFSQFTREHWNAEQLEIVTWKLTTVWTSALTGWILFQYSIATILSLSAGS